MINLKKTISFFFLIIPTFLFGQKAETLERVTADHFPEKNKLYVQFNPANEKKAFSYLEEGSDSYQSLPSFFSTRIKKKRRISVLAEFVNPLKYQLDIALKVSDDPRSDIITQFFSSNFKPSITGAFPEIAAGGSTSTILLPDWLYHIKDERNVPSQYILNVKKEAAEIEAILYKEFKAEEEDLGAPNRTFEGHIKNRIVELKKKETTEGFKAELQEAIKMQQALKGLTDKLMTKLEKLKTLINTPQEFTSTLPFKEYSLSFTDKLEQTVKQLINSKIALNNDFRGILDYAEKVKFEGNYIVLSVDEIELENKKEYTITLKAIEKSIDDVTLKVSNKKTYESQFVVIIGRFNVDVSGGVASIFKPLTLNSFNSYQDSTSFRINNSPTTKLFIPTIYLNFYSKINDELVLILPQVGVGTGKEYPTIFLGGGLVAFGKIVFSVGVANVYNQKLKEGFAVNQKIKADEVINFKSQVYSYKPEFRPYASLQIRF